MRRTPSLCSSFKAASVVPNSRACVPRACTSEASPVRVVTFTANCEPTGSSATDCTAPWAKAA
ncbi:MAG: hypothetical protein ACD_23C01336G0001 [uncultured bacterium]|nr:MAG: hypothetical protein ACD_23C01336G0001 [uncultured bacterium]